MVRGRLHIDTDCGVDDALALMLLVRGGADIEAVSAVFGNTYVDQAAANARGVLRLSGCPADVYIGAGHGIARRRAERMRPAHGIDGLNGAGFPQRWKLPVLERGHGVDIIAYAARRGGRGLFLGPLTNLAHALIGDPAALRNWRPLVMAGAFEQRGLGPGGADFNSWSDPEALHKTLEADVHPRLVPIDITARMTLSQQDIAAWCSEAASAVEQRLARALPAYMTFHSSQWRIAGCHPHDAVVAAAVLWPELFSFEPARLKVDMDGVGQGRIERIEGRANAEVCVDVNAEALRQRIMALLFPAAAGVQSQDA